MGKEYLIIWERDKAIYHYEKSLQIAPNAILPRMNLAGALAMKKRHQEAISQLQIVLNYEPGNAKARTYLLDNKNFGRQLCPRLPV